MKPKTRFIIDVVWYCVWVAFSIYNFYYLFTKFTPLNVGVTCLSVGMIILSSYNIAKSQMRYRLEK